MSVLLHLGKDEIRKKILHEEPFHVQQDITSLPQTTLDLYHADKEKQNVVLELAVKNISKRPATFTISRDWKQFDEEKVNLKNLFTNAEKTMNENSASLARFREIVTENFFDAVMLNEEITRTAGELDYYKSIRKTMKEYVEEYSTFETFLENVAQDSNEFHSVQDMLNKYESLELTRKECWRLLEEEIQESVDLKDSMSNLLEKKSAELKNLMNHLSTVKFREKEAATRRLYWENTAQKIKDMITLKNESNMELKGGCWDLYFNICKHNKLPVNIAAENMEGQMDFINKWILYYKEVTTIATALKQSQQQNLGEEELNLKNTRKTRGKIVNN